MLFRSKHAAAQAKKSPTDALIAVARAEYLAKIKSKLIFLPESKKETTSRFVARDMSAKMVVLRAI